MKSKTSSIAQLFLRIALSLSFLSAVADRFGLWGRPGDAGVAWGNWEAFITYSNTLNSFLPTSIAYFAGVVATVAEILFGILLLIGYKIRLTALLSGILLCCFALAMTFAFGPKSPFDYSVWTAAGGAFLLNTVIYYPYSIDYSLSKKAT
jgi:uncharacterized membrane protein YphA (DoxX/SURF4 family)